MKVEDFEDEKTHEVKETPSEKQNKSETENTTESQTKEETQNVLDVEDKTEEKKLDTPEETSGDNKQDNSKIENTEQDKSIENSSPSTKEPKTETTDAQEAASPPTEDSQPTTDKKEEQATTSKQSEETPETENKEAEDTATGGTGPLMTENTPNAPASVEEDSTKISEGASESTAKETHKPENDNKYDLLDYLTSFIDTDNELNDVLAGYFARLCNILIQKRSDEIATYFFTKEHLLYQFAYHSYSKSLTDTVIKILDINTYNLDIDESEINRVRREFIKKLLERLGDDKSEVCYEYSLNIFQIFNELTFKNVYYVLLIEDSVLNTLGELLKKDSPECSTNAAIRILNVLISHLRDYLSNMRNREEYKRGFDDDDDDNVVLKDDDEETAQPGQKAEEELESHPLVKFFINNIITYVTEQLDKAPEKVYIDFQYGDNQFVLGKKRLACINLMESLVELDVPEVRNKILESDFYEKLFNLFLQYRFNTFLQLHLDNIFHHILKDSKTSNEEKVAFIKKLGIFEKLPPFWNDDPIFQYPSQREFRHANLAFTTRMANTLKELSSSIEEIAEMFKSTEWQNFFDNDVAVYNEKNNIVLANRGGRRDSSDIEGFDEDEPHRFDNLEIRDDLDDRDEEGDEDDDDDQYRANRNSMRETLQKYDPNEAIKEHEEDFIKGNIEKDKDEENLFSGLNARVGDDDSDDDKIIGEPEKEKEEEEGVSENSSFYDINYWQVSQYNIEDLLNP